MKIYKILFVITIAIHTLSFSQVGIGTQSPNGALHIDGLSNNTTTATTKYEDDVIVTNNGNVGVGNITPSVKLDIRSNTNSAIGLGNSSDTDLTAANAKAGAIKYYYTSNTDKGIKYSDGNNWIKRNSTDVKALVFARKNSSQTINGNTQTNITNWTEDYDRTESFASDVFTAPRSSVYIATLNVALQSSSIANDSTLEVQLISNSTTGIPLFKCVYSFPGIGSDTVNNVVSGSCTGVFYLSAGNTIIPQVFQNIGGTSSRNILNDSSYNTLSITEL